MSSSAWPTRLATLHHLHVVPGSPITGAVAGVTAVEAMLRRGGHC
jgi:hypothetical protein